MDITANRQQINTVNSDNKIDFEKNLSSQNIAVLPQRTRMSAQQRSQPRHISDPIKTYGAVPEYRATPNDAYTYSINNTGNPVIMINEKQTPFADNPAITLKNDLEIFSAELPDEPSFKTMRSSAQHAANNIKKLMTVYPAPAANARERKQNIDRTTSHLQETEHRQKQTSKRETDQNLVRIDGTYNPDKKGVPSMVSLVASKILSAGMETSRSRADYAKDADSVILNAAFRNLGSKGEQAERLSDFLTTSRFTSDQKQDIVSALNRTVAQDRQNFPNAPTFTVENFSTIKDSLPALLNSNNDVTVETFVADVRKNLDEPSLLQNFIQTATFDDVYSTARVNNVRGLFLNILQNTPTGDKQTLFEDLSNLTKPYRK